MKNESNKIALMLDRDEAHSLYFFLYNLVLDGGVLLDSIATTELEKECYTGAIKNILMDLEELGVTASNINLDGGLQDWLDRNL